MADDVVAVAAARAEFQRKQRDRKRLYRARLKNDMVAMRAQVSELEAAYESLYAQRIEQQQRRQQQQQQQVESDAVPTLETILSLDDDDTNDYGDTIQTQKQRYAAARTEIATLRRQVDARKKQLSDFDLFTASLACYLHEFPSPPGSATSSSSSDSPSHSTTSQQATLPLLQPPHTLRSPFVSQLTADVCHEIIRDCYQQLLTRQPIGRSVSSGAEMLGWTDARCVDGPTLQFALTKTFPTLDSASLMAQTWDILTTERHMRTLQRSTTNVTVLQRVTDDIVLLERRADHKELDCIACVHLLVFRFRTERGCIVAFKALNPPGSPQEQEATAAGTAGAGGGRAKLAWVDTMQWFRFDDLADGGTHVTIAGRTANCDDSYAQFFLFEVVTFVVRWESAVAGARLLQL